MNATLEKMQSLMRKAHADAPRALSLAELADDLGDAEPTDVEIVDVLVETFGMTHGQAIDRLNHIDTVALRAALP
ncbi:hypothetical protein INH39_25395 [Massilia violaceinigra]|uniref:Carrier domain-containing protein n=1 Tax=Massilia violaceinigra TaxID=2045208 RepID=A0ABY4A1W9_9BURK|nr:hypothetical protein [Massilia violaceinigra]UOD28746.1 hypothetical protein INH39_25395 [Massilia violaceinigra]